LRALPGKALHRVAAEPRVKARLQPPILRRFLQTQKPVGRFFQKFCRKRDLVTRTDSLGI